MMNMHEPWITALLTVLVIGATLRLTRFVVSDSLGEWLIVSHARRWGKRHENTRILALTKVMRESEGDRDAKADLWIQDQLTALEKDEPISWQGKLASGLECPFCVGFWIGLGIILLTVLLAPLPIIGPAWAILLAALTLNYATAHLSSRID